MRASWVVLLAGGLAIPARAETARLEVVVKGDERQAQTAGKPALDLPVDPYETIRRSIAPDDALLRPQAPLLSAADAARLPWLKSRQGARPWNDAVIVKADDLRLRVKSELDKSSAAGSSADARLAWTVSVIDEDGAVFHRFDGSGQPPEALSWTGRSDKGRWLSPGHSYSAVYTFSSAGGPETTLLGEPIRLKAVRHSDRNGEILSLDSSILFGSRRDQPQMQSDGAALLGAAADWIRRTAFGSAVEVRVYGSDRELARRQALEVREALLPELALPDRMIIADGVAGPDSENRLDLGVVTALR